MMRMPVGRLWCGLMVLSLWALPGCAGSPEDRPAGEAVTIVEEWRGQQSEQEEAGLEVIRDEAGWQRVWEQVPGEEEPPEVDFSRHTAIAAWMGSRPTGGYDLRIREVRDESDHLAVAVEHRQPGPDEALTQALTSPYHIVLIPESDKPIRSVEE